MSLERQPFSAAVGVETDSQYRDLCSTEFDQRLGTAAIGVLMSEKTGLLGVPNRHGPIYPTFEDTESIFEAKQSLDNRSLSVIIHYNTDEPRNVGEQLRRALAVYGDGVDAVQVNGLRAKHLNRLANFKEHNPEVDLVFQVDAELMTQLSYQELARYVSAGADIIDYVWLDGSGGLGKPLNPADLLPLISEIKDRQSGVGIGVAGGLRADNLEQSLSSILAEYPDISWDAQSGVQLTVEGQKRFDVDEARKFLLGSLALRRQFA